MLRSSLGVFVVVGALLAACGGSTASEIFDPIDASSDVPVATAPDGSVVVPDGSVVVPDGSVVVPDGSAGPDGATTPDAAGPGSSPSRLPCGPFTCNIPGESCCVGRTSGTTTYACFAGGTCPVATGGNTTALKCRGAANCGAGTVCCVTQNNTLTTSACNASCGNNDAQLCDPAAVPTGCRAAEPCSSNNIGDWRLPAPYATCGGKGN